jgi:hypothetical protein
MAYKIQTINIREANFETALADVETLMSLYNELILTKSGRPHFEYEVLKRAAIILLVTAWESFIEHVILQEYENKLDKAKNPKDVQTSFNAFADSWSSKIVSKKIKPYELESLTSDGWKLLLLDMCRKEITLFNTPSYDNIDRLFRKYIDVPAEQVLKVPGYNKMWIRTNLNILINYRGNLVHKSKRTFSISKGVPKQKVVKSIRLISGCVKSIQKYFKYNAV